MNTRTGQYSTGQNCESSPLRQRVPSDRTKESVVAGWEACCRLATYSGSSVESGVRSAILICKVQKGAKGSDWAHYFTLPKMGATKRTTG